MDSWQEPGQRKRPKDPSVAFLQRSLSVCVCVGGGDVFFSELITFVLSSAVWHTSEGCSWWKRRHPSACMSAWFNSVCACVSLYSLTHRDIYIIVLFSIMPWCLGVPQGLWWALLPLSPQIWAGWSSEPWLAKLSLPDPCLSGGDLSPVCLPIPLSFFSLPFYIIFYMLLAVLFSSFASFLTPLHPSFIHFNSADWSPRLAHNSCSFTELLVILLFWNWVPVTP